MADIDRITLVILKEDGTREKFPLRTWVGVPRKTELVWLGDEPYVVVEVEYAIAEGFFGGKSIEAAGVYIRHLTNEEQSAVARRLTVPAKGADEQKAKLALLGFTAKVQPITINGKTWNRVRVGPYASASELENAKKTLTDSGVAAIALKEAANQ